MTLEVHTAAKMIVRNGAVMLIPVMKRLCHQLNGSEGEPPELRATGGAHRHTNDDWE